MFPAEWGDVVSGIILMTVLGLSIGNYATSIVYRLPRGLKIANDPPYCECERRMYLQVRDNFPFFSWLVSRGKCRWCDIRIPGLYAMVELACAVLFVTGLWRFGLGDELILVLSLGVFLITQYALYYNERRLYTIMVLVIAGFGAMYRILLDETIFGFVRGGFLALVCGMVLWRVRRFAAKEKTSMPDYVVMLGVAGGCVGEGSWIALCVLSFVLWSVCVFFGRRYSDFRAASPCLAVSFAILVLLYDPAVLTRWHSDGLLCCL